MEVDENKGPPTIDSQIVESPLSQGPQEGTPHFGKSHMGRKKALFARFRV